METLESENESGTKYAQIDYCWKLIDAEARDLAKLLNYWADKGKLPKQITIKESK